MSAMFARFIPVEFDLFCLRFMQGEYRQDNQFDVDVEIEIEITDDVDDTDIGGEDGEFEIEITIDAESDDQASTLLAQKLAEQLPIQLSGIMEKVC